MLIKITNNKTKKINELKKRVIMAETLHTIKPIINYTQENKYLIAKNKRRIMPKPFVI